METSEDVANGSGPEETVLGLRWGDAMEDASADVPPRVLAISVFALAVAALAAMIRPATGAEYAAFLWILGLIPPFLLSFYHGWTGAVRALAAGMLALTVTEVAVRVLGTGEVDWWIYGGATTALVAVSLGSGFLAEMLRQSGGTPGAADREGTRRQELQRAVDEGELLLHFQPIVSMEDRKTLGIEALVRWDHPRRGLLDASDFVAFAETAGLLVPISNWAMEEALRQFGLWRERFPSSPRFYVSLNLSTEQCRQRGFVERLRSLLDRHDMEGEELHVEVTEETLDVAGTQLSQIVGLGAGLAIDDFGTGHVSLSQLAHLRIDTLKIDGFFVSRMLHSPPERATVDAAIRVADALGIAVTAEAVETEEQYRMLRELGCDRGQGSFFAEPFPATALESHFASG